MCSSLASEKVMRLAIALLLFALFQSATAETRYVGVSTLNVRDQPSGAIVAKLERGAAVEVVESNNGWSKISMTGADQRWVASNLLCDHLGCTIAPLVVTRQASQNRSNRTFSSSPRTQLTGGGYSAECPCSGSNNCIGRRGGRFCITSSGNKRYR